MHGSTERVKRWSQTHWRNIACYAAIGTAAWLVGYAIQTALVEGVDVGKMAAYGLQFLPVQILYYKLIRRYMKKGEHHHWRRCFHRLAALNFLQLVAGAGLYKAFLLVLPYIAALPLSSVALTLPFFAIKMLTDAVFQQPAVQMEAKA